MLAKVYLHGALWLDVATDSMDKRGARRFKFPDDVAGTAGSITERRWPPKTVKIDRCIRHKHK